MRNLFIASLCSALFTVFVTPAFASYDGSCSANLKVFQSDYERCNSIGFLSPNNDTRINLTFLMADARGQKLDAGPDSTSLVPMPTTKAHKLPTSQ